jgi:hypothetical protein
MIKRRVYYLIICLATGIVSVMGLYFLSAEVKHRPNGFIRLLPPHFAEPVDHFDLKYNSFYTAGVTKNEIYLANYTTPYRLLRIGYNLKDTFTYVINWSKDIQIRKGALIAVDSNTVYLKDGISSVVYRADLTDLNQVSNFKTPPFTASINASLGIFIYRSISAGETNVLIEQNFGEKRFVQNPNLLQKQGEGLFSTDGILVKVPGSSKFIYVYYYRNQFFCADSNLKLVYRAKTLDTISNVHIKVSPINSLHEITMAAPPLLVNRKACASDKYLFVNSALNANNEAWQILKTMSIVDVYDLKNGQYKVSFYLPNFAGKKASDFKVCGNTLFAIYDHFIVVYHLNF